VSRPRRALTHLPLHIQGRISRLVRQIVAASQLWCIYQATRVHTLLAGRYCSVGVAGSGVCREARDGVCVRHAEEMRSVETTETCITGADPGQCAPNHCNVQIGDSVYCSQCSGGSSETSSPAPTNGVCTTDNNECSVKADGRCTTCAHESFMFQGGCYATAKAPGNTMCTNAASGVCNAAADGYFVPPAADRDASHQSVIPCGDDSVVTVKDDKQYKGVANCLTCTPPGSGSADAPTAATCTKCEDGYFVDTNKGNICSACAENCLTCTSATETTCQSCTANTYFLGAPNEGQGPCVSCGDASGETWKGVANCAKCNKPADQNTPATCTECAEGYYLKTDGTSSCVTDCGEGFFATTVDNVKKCVSCSAVGNGGIANCKTCSLLAQGSRAAPLVSCLTCEGRNLLTPTKEACLDACPAGSYSSGGACAPCDPSCTECSAAGAERCTACPAGRMLRYADEGQPDQGGQCVAECTVGADGCAECGLAIGGTRYCSKCATETWAPQNGVCANTAAARSTFCTTASGGVCTQCAAGYFIQEGGCYQTTRLPGKSVCTTESGGKCQACANGQTPESSTGVCPLCDPTCKTCEAANTKQCKTCFSGYYLDANKACKKCSETSGNIQGVKDCVSCDPPTSNSGPVTCYVTQEPTVDPADPSGNKTGLSSGAIAGISVAVIAVVGGLVGFLCWWFVCRGKA
ncbi:Variant-specific surface protein, partial [Giardia duodenalis]